MADRNRAAILVFEFLWGLAMPLVQYSTVLPGYLRHLGVANVWIGLAPALYNGALALVQPIAAYAIPAGPRRLGRMRCIYMAGSLGYVVAGLAVLGGISSPAAGLAAALLATGLFAVTTGIGDPPYMGLVTGAVRPEQRGRFFGLRFVCLGTGGIAGGMLAEQTLLAEAAPANFGLCFLVGGLLYLLSTFSMAFYRDRTPPEPKAPDGFRRFVADRLLARFQQPAFRAYALAVVLLGLAVGGFPFLALLLRDRLGESDQLFGLLGAIFMASNLGMSWMLGVVCDRWGARQALALGLAVYAAGVVGCLLFRDRTALLVCYFLASTWMPAQVVAATDLGLRLADGAPAAEVFATMMAVMAPARILGPVLAGAAIDRWSYTPALVACAACAAVALIALARAAPARHPRAEARDPQPA